VIIMYVYIILLASLFSTIGQYLDKHLVNLGVSKKDYCYYMCLSTIPFTILMLIIEYFTQQLRFYFYPLPFILILFAMFFRYKKLYTVVGCLKHLNPYEDSAYLSLSVILAYIIDLILKIETFNYISIISIILTITGVFILSSSKLKIRNLQKSLIIRILSSLMMGYVTHYILQYWSNAFYMLLLNLMLTLIFSKDYTIKYNKEHSNIIKWVFIQQTFGFSFLYLSNYLSSNSVTLSSYIKPMSVIMVVILSMFIKQKDKKPNIRQIIAIILVIFGVVLINK